MTTLPLELKKACEEMAETQRIYEPKYGGKDHSGYETMMKYEVNYERIEAYCAGFTAAYELMEGLLKDQINTAALNKMAEGLKNQARQNELLNEHAKSQKLVEALKEAAEFDRCDDVNGMAGEICAKALAEYRGE